MQVDDGRLEESLGFPQFNTGEPRLGWLMNFNAVRFSCAAFLTVVLLQTTCIDHGRSRRKMLCDVWRRTQP